MQRSDLADMLLQLKVGFGVGGGGMGKHVGVGRWEVGDEAGR